MLIVGENLRCLVEQYEIVSNLRSYDINSLTLTLDKNIVQVIPNVENAEITYGHQLPEEWIQPDTIKDSGLLLPPKSSVLGCSHEIVKMPKGYFGLMQTKGSLARLFVLANCCDGQVEAGYSGRITFEISNLSNFGVRLLPHQPIAQLFIFKTSTRLVELYNGRYQGADKPTYQMPED